MAEEFDESGSLLVQKAIIRRAFIEKSYFKYLKSTNIDLFPQFKAGQEVFETLKEYYLRYENEKPTGNDIEVLLQTRLDRKGVEGLERTELITDGMDIIKNAKEVSSVMKDQMSNYLISVRSFVALKRAISKPELTPESVFKLSDELLSIRKETVAETLPPIIHFDLINNYKHIAEVLKNRDKNRCMLPETNPFYEALEGGLARGELGCIAASSGEGKTHGGVSLAGDYLKSGYNVLYLSLEELDSAMYTRFARTLLYQLSENLDVPDDVLKDMASKETISEKFYDEETKNSLFNNLAKMHNKHCKDNIGNLYFARFEPGELSVDLLDELLDTAINVRREKIDVIVIDYPDLMTVDYQYSDIAEKGGYLYERIRAMVSRYELVGWVMSQLNRSAAGAELKGAEHIEGSKKKVNTLEFLAIVNRDPLDKGTPFSTYNMAKVRNTERQVEPEVVVYTDQLTRHVRRATPEEVSKRADYIRENKNQRGALSKYEGTKGRDKLADDLFQKEVN